MKKSIYFLLCLVFVSLISFSQSRDSKRYFPPPHPLFERFENNSDENSTQSAFNERHGEKLHPPFKDKFREYPDVSKRHLKQNDYNVGEELEIQKIKSTESDSIKEDWVRHYSSLGVPSRDAAFAIARDPNEGSIYVTGRSDSDNTGYDYLTIKYDTSGVQQWTARYNEPGNGDDAAYSIAIDNYGNIYVTGMSDGIATIKYNSSGVEQWVAKYKGPASGIGRCVLVDDLGNVYVTGNSEGIGTSMDYVTIKYSTFGVEQWVALYDGPANAIDDAYSIAIDDSYNVYITGLSHSSWTNRDFATIKYNSSGIEQWVARYNGPANDWDAAYSIGLDNSGNVYVTGFSTGLNTYSDYATIKYNSTGAQQWVARYNGTGNGDDVAHSLKVDIIGNVYVTGASYSSGTMNDYATIKYNSSGAEQWVVRYDGTGNWYDKASSITLDDSNFIYVTGYSSGPDSTSGHATIKYDSSGAEQWVAIYNGPANSEDEAYSSVTDNSGNVYITGFSTGLNTYSDYATIKYNSLGVEQWIAIYNGPGKSYDRVASIAVDKSGSVFVAGTSYASGSSHDFVTIKYNSSGVQEWVVRYNGPGNSKDEVTSISIGNSGDLFVTGTSYDSVTSSDYATIKYNSFGIEQWVARYNGTGNSFDVVYSMAIDDSDNVYITGKSAGSGSNLDYATIKYNSSGVEQWIARYNGPGGYDDKPYSIKVDIYGNVYVTGTSYGSATSWDFATIKYNSSGEEQWVAIYNGSANSVDEAYSSVIDYLGNVYVTGSSLGGEPLTHYATIKYDSSGEKQWVTRSSDGAYSIAIDASGNLYVMGWTTTKYNSSGEEKWVASYEEQDITSIAVDNFGNLYVTGYGFGSELGHIITVKYDSLGLQRGIARYDGEENSYNLPAALVVDTSGNIYAAATSDNHGDIWTTIKYSQLLSSINGEVFVDINSNGMKEESEIGIPQWLVRLHRTSDDSQIDSVCTDDIGNFSFKYLSQQSYYLTQQSDNCWSPTIPETLSFNLSLTNPSATLKFGNYGLNPTILKYQTSWNLISLPLNTCAKALSELFPAASSKAFLYTGNNYESKDSLIVGIGYWLKLPADHASKIFTGELIAIDTLELNEGWNMIGSISSPLVVTDIGIEPPELTTSKFFRYSGIYIIADSLQPGKGYWVKADRDGKLILNSVSESFPVNRIKIVDRGETPPPPPESNEIPSSNKPTAYMLEQNYPNPFNPITNFRFSIVDPQLTIIKIYDVLGREVATLVNELKQPGIYTVEWDASAFPSGIYFYRLYTGNFIETKKLILLK